MKQSGFQCVASPMILPWAEKRSTVALANYVPCIPAEAARIARLGAFQIVSCPSNSSTSEEEEARHPELQTTDTEPEWEEESEDRARQTDLEEEVEPNRWRCLRDWEAIMEGLEGLTYDDPQSDSNAMVTGADGLQGPALSLCGKATNPLPHTLRHAAPSMPGSLMDHMLPLEAAIAGGDAVEVHVDEAELDNL